jgi:hypothetical protein
MLPTTRKTSGHGSFLRLCGATAARTFRLPDTISLFAAIQVHALTEILTFNKSDFARYSA